MLVKTNKKHFELFKQECQKWIDKLELNRWDVAYQWKNLTPQGIDGAAIEGQSAYHATLTLDTEIDDYNIGDKPIIEEIKESAKHEVMHLLLKRYSILAKNRFISPDDLYDTEESVVRMLCKIIK